MDFPKSTYSSDLNSAEHVTTNRYYAHNSFAQTQTTDGINNSPHKLPPAPQTSPEIPCPKSTTSRLDDNFTSELMKACSTSFSNLNFQMRLTSSSPLPTESNPSGAENQIGSFRFFDHCCPTGLNNSLSQCSLSPYSCPYSDKASLLAHRVSDVSDISLNDSQTLLSDDDTVDSWKPEGHDKMDTEHSINCYEVSSPRRPKSSVGAFLNWRKNMKERKKLKSVDNLYSPCQKKIYRNSEFLNTI